ncbi:C45 family autoproteolytic acyltransferase/hydrolase [Sutcliffiella cohnii]
MINRNETAIRLSGTAYNIGFEHGKLAKDKIHVSLATYEKMFFENASLSWKDATDRALLHVNAIEKYNDKFIEEMQGVADGADVSFEDILALNARSEIALVMLDGCTSFALTDPKTSDTWLAQNWDWKSAQAQSLVHLSIEQKDYPTINMVTEAGIIGKIGSNSEGIGVCLNALVTDTWEPKVPIHLGLRAVLQSATFEEALSKVEENQLASCAHFLIGSKSTQLASVEVSPHHTVSRTTNSGILTHTNHICDESLKRKVNEDILPDSLERLSTMDSLLQNTKVTNEADLFSLLSNHHNHPYSICRHECNDDNVPYNKRMETVFSIVMNLTNNELTWIKGKPCEVLVK